MAGMSIGKQVALIGGLGAVGAGGIAFLMTRDGDDKVPDAPKDPAADAAAQPAVEDGATVAGPDGAIADAPVMDDATSAPLPTGMTAGSTDTGFDPTALGANGMDSSLVSPQDYAAALLAAQGGNAVSMGTAPGAPTSLSLDRARLPISNYSNDPGGVFTAIDRAAPRSWSSANVQLVGNAALASGSSAFEASRMVSEVYNSTPYSWTGNAEAQVAATGLTVHRNAADTGNVIDQVEYGTPWNWSTSSDIRLSIAALHGGVPSSRVDDVIREASNATYGEASGVALAEQRLLAGSTGSSYPSYPGYPDSGNSYPTYPTYPDYGNSYPTYPSYPSYPSYPDTSTGDSGYGFPSYPSYPDTSTGDSGYGYPDSGGYSSPGDSGYSYPSSGYSGGYTSGGDS